MISDTEIRATLNDLDRLYNAYPAEATYYSKLAMLEYCGWLELTIDTIISDCSNSKLTVKRNLDYVENQIIKRTYGFKYLQHFGFMLRSLIGLIQVENIELKYAATGQMSQLETHLDTYSLRRNQVAHTYISGVVHNYDTPSQVLAYLNQYYPILKLIETEVV